MDTVKTVFTLIEKDDMIVLIQEGFEPSYGRWCLPGGHVDEGEDIKDAAKREALEETGGLEVEIKEKILSRVITNQEYQGREDENGRMIEVNIFKAIPIGGEISKEKLTQELDVRWVNKEEAKQLPLRWPWLKNLF